MKIERKNKYCAAFAERNELLELASLAPEIYLSNDELARERSFGDTRARTLWRLGRLTAKCALLFANDENETVCTDFRAFNEDAFSKRNDTDEKKTKTVNKIKNVGKTRFSEKKEETVRIVDSIDVATLLKRVDFARATVVSRDSCGRGVAPFVFEVTSANEAPRFAVPATFCGPTISHLDGATLAAVPIRSRTAVGCDVVERKSVSAAIEDFFFTERERFAARRADAFGLPGAELVWALKESVYKSIQRETPFAPLEIETDVECRVVTSERESNGKIVVFGTKKVVVRTSAHWERRRWDELDWDVSAEFVRAFAINRIDI